MDVVSLSKLSSVSVAGCWPLVRLGRAGTKLVPAFRSVEGLTSIVSSSDSFGTSNFVHGFSFPGPVLVGFPCSYSEIPVQKVAYIAHLFPACGCSCLMDRREDYTPSRSPHVSHEKTGLGPSKILLLQSRQMANSPNRTNVTFRPNIPPAHPNPTYPNNVCIKNCSLCTSFLMGENLKQMFNSYIKNENTKFYVRRFLE